MLDDLGHTDDGITHVAARFGYMEEPHVPRALAIAVEAGLDCSPDPAQTSFFLSTIALHAGRAPGMPRWRTRLFIATARTAADAAEYFRLPSERTVMMGYRIDV